MFEPVGRAPNEGRIFERSDGRVKGGKRERKTRYETLEQRNSFPQSAPFVKLHVSSTSSSPKTAMASSRTVIPTKRELLFRENKQATFNANFVTFQLFSAKISKNRRSFIEV